MRVLVLALALVFAGIVGAEEDDDEKLLESPALGESIPERTRALEREWAHDVGVAEPPDETETAPSPPAEVEDGEAIDEERSRPDGQPAELPPPSAPPATVALPPQGSPHREGNRTRAPSRPPATPAARATPKPDRERSPTDAED